MLFYVNDTSILLITFKNDHSEFCLEHNHVKVNKTHMSTRFRHYYFQCFY